MFCRKDLLGLSHNVLTFAICRWRCWESCKAHSSNHAALQRSLHTQGPSLRGRNSVLRRLREACQQFLTPHNSPECSIIHAPALKECICSPSPQTRDNRRKNSYPFQNVHRDFPEATSLQRPLSPHKAFSCSLYFTFTHSTHSFLAFLT